MKKLFSIILYVLSCNLVMGQNITPKGDAKTIDSLKLKLKEAGHDTIRLRILSAIIANINDDNIWPKYNLEMKQVAEKNMLLNPPDKALNIYKKYFAESINNSGYIEEQQGDVKLAIKNYFEALKLFEEINYNYGIAEAYNNIGVYYDGQGDIEKAIEFHLKSLKIKESIKDSTGLALTLNNLGMTYQKQGMIEKAIGYYSRSLAIKEHEGNKNGEAYTFNNLGSIYQAQGDLQKAQEYYSKSLKLWEEVDNKDGILTAVNNMGWIYFNLRDTAKAMEKYRLGEKLSEKLGDKQAMGLSYNNLGTFFFDKRDYKNSLIYLNKSLKILEEIGDKDTKSNVLCILGRVHYELRNFKEAEKIAEQSLKLSKEIGYPENIMRSADLLKSLYKQSGKYTSAIEMFELSSKMKDSLENEKTKKASLRQQFKYEYEKKTIADSLKNAGQILKEQIKHEEEIKQQRLYTYGGIIGFVLMIIVAGVSFNAYRNKQKANTIINAQKTEVEKQKHIIEEKQKEIVDSINYAKRIQYTLLAHDAFLKENLPDHFVFFKPKDIVSGDFYWASKKENRFYLAVCDSTGHGVPGAFMSLLSIGFLTEAINEKGIIKPNEVLNHVRKRLIEGISKEGQRDGFDGILVCIDISKKEITYSAANNPPLIIQNGELKELKADKMPVGIGEKTEDFELFKINFTEGELLYLYTDGFADQFGGPKGKKFKYKPLNQLLLSNALQPLQKQNELLNTTFENWKGNLEQVDDVCIIGIRL